MEQLWLPINDSADSRFFTDEQLKYKGSRRMARLALMCSRPKKSWRVRVRKMSEKDMLQEYKRWRVGGDATTY